MATRSAAFAAFLPRGLIWLILAGGLAVSGTPLPSEAGASLSDEEKKEIVYGMYADYKREFPAVADISPKEAVCRMKTGRVVFVDTRTAAEMAVSTLPGAISREAFLRRPATYEGQTVIAYCTISYRSGKFAEEMAARGIRIYNLTGGLLAWVLEGGKVYAGGVETRRIHVYGKKWDYPPSGYESVVFGLLDRLFGGIKTGAAVRLESLRTAALKKPGRASGI